MEILHRKVFILLIFFILEGFEYSFINATAIDEVLNKISKKFYYSPRSVLSFSNQNIILDVTLIDTIKEVFFHNMNIYGCVYLERNRGRS
jgi:hypothetical protein